MRAAVFHGPRDIRVEAVADPKPERDEVMIDVKASGICGTDLGIYQGHYPCRVPVILGHEYAGTVEAIGADVEGVELGTRVISTASWGCGKCEFCLRGEESLCLQRVTLGRGIDGAFAEKVAVPARVIIALPGTLSFEEAQSAVTVACAVRAIRRSGLREGETMAIFGGGHAGLILLQLALHTGASKAIVLDIRTPCLELASRLGAQGTINVTSEPWLERGLELSDGDGFDLVIEATSNPKVLLQGLQLVKNGGRLLAFSVFGEPVDAFPAPELYNKELTIIGTRGGHGAHKETLELMASKAVDVRPLISHRLPLERVPEGFECAEKREEDVMRVVFTP